MNRRARPIVVGGGLVALCAAVAATVAAVSGGPALSSGALSSGALAGSARAEAVASAAALPAAALPAAARPARPAHRASGSLTLTGATTPRLIVPDVIASVPGGVTAADLRRLRALGGVRAVLAI